MKTRIFAISTALLLSACVNEDIYTLYKNSDQVSGAYERIHIATFDTSSDKYNYLKCQEFSEILQNKEKSVVKYWCEKGRYKK